MNFDTVEIGLYNMNEWLRKKNLKFGLIAGGHPETPQKEVGINFYNYKNEESIIYWINFIVYLFLYNRSRIR